MPDAAADPHAGVGVERVALSGPDGSTVAVVTPSERGGAPWADLVWTPPETPVAFAASALLETFATAFASVESAELRDALVTRDAVVDREASTLSRSLISDPPPATWHSPEQGVSGVRLEWLTVERAESEAAGLAEAYVEAFPPGHPDHDPMDLAHAERAVQKIVHGDVLGPLLPGSMLARDAAGRVAGALMLTDRDGEAPYGGPWVTQVFRRPGSALRGLGAAMLRRGLARSAADGRTDVSLVVTGGNPARGVYERLGFRVVQTSWTLRLPAAH